MLSAGDCLLIETNRDRFGYIKSHLFVIVLEPQGANRIVIIVNIESFRSPKQDQTTILEPGVHEFVIRHSYVNYARARLVPIDELEMLIKSGDAKVKSPLDSNTFKKVCDGILKSKFTPYEVRDVYENYLFSQL